MPHVQERSLVDRAVTAYFRRLGPYADQPGWGMCTEEQHDGKSYVVLRNGARTLAVYREKPDGRLKRLQRWSKALN